MKKELEALKLLEMFFEKEENLRFQQINFKDLSRGCQKDNQMEDKLRKLYEAIDYQNTLVIFIFIFIFILLLLLLILLLLLLLVLLLLLLLLLLLI